MGKDVSQQSAILIHFKDFLTSIIVSLKELEVAGLVPEIRLQLLVLAAAAVTLSRPDQ